MVNRTSQETLAEMAGVTQGTVSRALRNDPRVSVPVRERVRRLAREHGYTLNALAKALREKRTNTVGLVFSGFLYPKHTELISLLVSQLGLHNYDSVLRVTGGDAVQEDRCLRGLFGMQVAGLILFSSTDQPDGRYIELACRKGIATVVIERPCAVEGVDVFGTDVEQAAYELLTHLQDMGRRKIVAIQPKGSYEALKARMRALRRAYREAELDPEQAVIVPLEGDRSYNGGYQAAQEILSKMSVDALFCANDEVAIGAVKAVLARGLRVPEDVAVVGFDDIPNATFCQAPITTQRFPAKELAEAAVACVRERLEGSFTGPGRTFRVPHELVIRESTCKGGP